MRKKALVTGGSRGIGRGIAIVLAENGYDVALSYNSKGDEALKTVSEIEKAGGKGFSFCAKLDRRGEGEALFRNAVKALSGLDLLVNNAGVTKFESLDAITDETLDFLIDLDFRNYVIMMREAARYFIGNGIKGNIINITSSRGQRAYPEDGIYGGLKAGLNRAIESFALDVAKHGIRINNVAPGAIRVRSNEELQKTESAPSSFWDRLGPRIPLKRCGLPADIADAIAFLASDAASYITGVTLRVDGGLILPGMPEVVADDSNISWTD